AGFERDRHVAGYNYSIDWTPLLAGLSPAGMAARLAARHTCTVDGSAASRPVLEGKAEVRGARSPVLSKWVGPQSSLINCPLGWSESLERNKCARLAMRA